MQAQLQKVRVTAWARRYLPSEIASTVIEFGAAYIVYAMTASIATASIAATVGQFIGYYAIAYLRALRWTLKAHKSMRCPSALLLALRSVLVEFGPAELLNTAIVRPIAFYALPLLLDHVAVGWIVAKIISDLAFYACAIYSRARYPHLVAEPSKANDSN